MVFSPEDFNHYKNPKELSRFEAMFDLMLISKDGLNTNMTILKDRWGWQHRSKVVRFLQELQLKKFIEKQTSKKGTVILFIS